MLQLSKEQLIFLPPTVESFKEVISFKVAINPMLWEKGNLTLNWTKVSKIRVFIKIPLFILKIYDIEILQIFFSSSHSIINNLHDTFVHFYHVWWLTVTATDMFCNISTRLVSQLFTFFIRIRINLGMFHVPMAVSLSKLIRTRKV